MLETSDLTVYAPGENGDADLLAWYLRLCDNGDMQKMFGDIPQPLGHFMRNYTDPDVSLLYVKDEQGWWGVIWAKPFMGGASWGFWVRPDKRGTPETVQFVLQFHEQAFQRTPLLVFATTSEQLVAQSARMGYTDLGAVPSLFGMDAPGHIMYCTPSSLEATLPKWKEIHDARAARLSA